MALKSSTRFSGENVTQLHRYVVSKHITQQHTHTQGRGYIMVQPRRVSTRRAEFVLTYLPHAETDAEKGF